MKDIIMKCYIALTSGSKRVMTEERGDAGVGFILTIAAALIVAAFVFIPGLRNFGNTIIMAINSWWTTTISPTIFPAS